MIFDNSSSGGRKIGGNRLSHLTGVRYVCGLHSQHVGRLLHLTSDRIPTNSKSHPSNTQSRTDGVYHNTSTNQVLIGSLSMRFMVSTSSKLIVKIHGNYNGVGDRDPMLQKYAIQLIIKDLKTNQKRITPVTLSAPLFYNDTIEVTDVEPFVGINELYVISQEQPSFVEIEGLIENAKQTILMTSNNETRLDKNGLIIVSLS